MSINSLANAASARRMDVGPANSVPHNVSEIAAASATPPEHAPEHQREASTVTTALNILFGYIPTEVVTLYVAVAAALQPATTVVIDPSVAVPAAPIAERILAASSQAQWISFWCFFVATPLAVWIVYASKLKAAHKPLPLSYASWPVWEMSAGLFAFFAWAFALPNTPFREFSWYSPALASIAVLLSSTALGLVAPLFQRPLSGSKG